VTEKATDQAIDTLLVETRTFAPPEEFVRRANVRDPKVYQEASDDLEGFWARFAEQLHWSKKWDRVLDWQAPWAKWFVGGVTNISYNCLDRHLSGPARNKAAIIWEGERGEERVLTYWDLHREVCKFANALKGLGVRKGDRVTVYMPTVPELPIALLACARIGAPHSVVFGGFSAEALRDRIQDAEAKVLITADGGYRGSGVVRLKQAADEAVAQCPTIEKVVVVRYVGEAVEAQMTEGRDVWWHELMHDASPKCEAEPMDAEDMLYILYTSGTTGKPKGIVHTTGGYMVGTYATTQLVFDLHDDDVYWCTADVGWVTGHSYIVYGPLLNGATVVFSNPQISRERWWSIVEKYGVTVFYTSPTAIRTFMRWGPQWPKRHDMSTLRLLGTVGEPINPEAWMWYWENVGGGRCPIVDTWWQTETGMIAITPLPGITTLEPGSATRPFPGIEADIVDEQGRSVQLGGAGYLVLKKPWPSMLRTIHRDPDRYVQQYWSRFPGIYFTGDGAMRDEKGYFRLLGRVDDVMNVAGHRLSTMEVESALVDHPAVAEAAVIGRADDLKGQAVVAFVTPKEGVEASNRLKSQLRDHVVEKIGLVARPDEIVYTAELPKTRSGKIMRRLLRDVAEGRALGDVTTLADPTVVQSLKEKYEAEEA
jgi:acetyl-CoA synthetase